MWSPACEETQMLEAAVTLLIGGVWVGAPSLDRPTLDLSRPL